MSQVLHSFDSPKPAALSAKATFWLVLAAMVLLASNMRAPIVALGSIAPIVQDALHISETQIGWLGAIPMLMFALGAFISPALGRRFGIENTLIAMIALLTAGMVIRSVIVSWLGFLIGTMLLTLAIGFANTLAAPVIKRRVPNHIALVTGVFSLTMTVFAGIAAGVVIPLSEQIGWQWALGGWALLGILAFLLWLLMRIKLGSSRQPTTQQHNHVNPPNAIPPKVAAVKELSEQSQLAAQHVINSEPHTPYVNVWRSAFAWQIAIFMGLQSLLFYTVASFLPSIWLSKGLTPIQAGHMGSMFQFMSPVAIIGLTWLVNRGKSIRAIAMVAAFVNVIGVAGMIYLTSKLAWLWSGMMGFGSSSIFTLSMMLFSMRTYNADQSSQLSGMAQTVGYSIAFAGPLGTGWLHDKTGSWDVALLIMLLFMIGNVGFAWLATRRMMIDGKPS